jgi:Calcineurin-like phosphoesterase
MLLLALLLPVILGTAPPSPAFSRDSAGLAVDGQRVSQAPGKRRQIVAILPDRTTGRDWGLRYLREAVDDLNREQPDAVFCVGDLVQGYSRDGAHVRGEHDAYLDITGRLKVPFYPTPGNHDLVGGRRSADDRTFADEYRRLFGPLYYSVELELASFVILNTEDGAGRIEPGFSDAQLAWLDRTLADLAARDRPIILLFHRPLWDHKPTRWDERVQPMLVKHGVDYVIAGHYHAMQMLPPKDGIPFLLLGTCGGAIDQHPLAGQLQHLSFVAIDESGLVQPYHQVAGCTLPVDWMDKEDQDLAYRLKSSRDTIAIRGSVADPLGRAQSGTVEVTIRNPLDRPVDFEFRKAVAPAAWEVVDSVATKDGPQEVTRVWTSRTALDIFNPFTTDLESPFELAFEPPSCTVPAGGTQTIVVSARSRAQVLPAEPPPFEILARYRDGKGRTVPILLRQRLPLARSPVVAEDPNDAVPYSVAVWNWSEYDTAEPNATVRFEKGADGRALEIRVEAAEDLVLSPDTTPADARSAIDDPLGDAVRVVVGEGPQSREFLVTVAEDGSTPVVRALSPDRKRLEATGDLAATLFRGSKGWRLQLGLAASAVPGGAVEGMAINIGVADNDQTYHTQWRWLAPKSEPARLRVAR